MLAGIGGRTIEEAQWRMSYWEAKRWALYLEKRGSLNVGMRLEMGFALLAAMINHALGGKAKPQDFMPHVGEVESPEATAEDIMKILTGAARSSKILGRRK